VTSTGPLRGEALTGLLLCTSDVDRARAAFEPWSLIRPAVYADATHIDRGYHGASASAPAAPR
jgi:hypothetical protein